MVNYEKLPDIMTVKEVAEFIHVSDGTVKRALRNGELEGFKPTRDWRIAKDAVRKWIESKHNN